METIGVIGQGKLVSLLLQQEGTVLLSGSVREPIDTTVLWQEAIYHDVGVIVNFHASFDGNDIQLVQANYTDAKSIANVAEGLSIHAIHMARSDDRRIVTLARNAAVLAFNGSVVMEYDSDTSGDDILLAARNLRRLMDEDNMITAISVRDGIVSAKSYHGDSDE